MKPLERFVQLRTEIEENRVPGGSAFARAAAELIAITLEQAPAETSVVELRTSLVELCTWLTAIKPSMAVVRNVASTALAESEGQWANVGEMRAHVSSAMRAYMAASLGAISRLAANWAVVAGEGRRVLVHSYSASLLSVLTAAAQASADFSVLITESRPYRESRRIAEALAASRVPVTLYSDAGVGIAATRADVALVGADSVFIDGSFANKTGTLPLALACKREGVPLFVATELAKLYPGAPEDITMELRPAIELADNWDLALTGRVQVYNQFFEVTPAELVGSYLTENGVLKPSQIAEMGRDGAYPDS